LPKLFLALVSLIVTASAVHAQSPSPTPDLSLGGYRITSATEVGYRWRSLDGNVNKYKSDLNYDNGFRFFDTNFLMESPSGKGKYFDSLLITNTGWGSDPSGATRFNMEKTGWYKFNSNVRRVNYFNNLYNFANPSGFADSEHAFNTHNNFGDFDLTLAPQNERLRITMGGSFSEANGPGITTERFFSDEYPITSRTDYKSNDFRIGAEGTLIGFDWGLLQGFRDFKDRSSAFLTASHPGNNPANQSRLDSLSKTSPVDGHAYYTNFRLHRTFAERFDFTARMIYSSTNSRSFLEQSMTGRDNTNPAGILVTSDKIVMNSEAKRPQTRADIGGTYMVTEKFRISDTFSFDQFNVSGSSVITENWIKANNARSSVTNTANRIYPYRRYANTIEGDYQFNRNLAFHLGYRYTHRTAGNLGFYRTRSCVSTSNPPCPTANPTVSTILYDDEETNSTNTFLAGMKIKPIQNWVIYWNIEHGEADNVFTRLENYKFTDFRVHSKLTFNRVSFNLSAFTKDNNNPSRPAENIGLPTNLDYITSVNNRVYTASVDWEASNHFSVSSGYTYRHVTSYTPIALPISGAVGPPVGYAFGSSQFFVRDHYFFFDLMARPVPRVSMYASYRIDRDKGQGDRLTLPTTLANPNIIGSYPIRYTTPEFRVAFRINRHVDWNVGYQYYDYKDIQTRYEDYRAHLPYTSLRVYFGGGTDNR